MRRIFAVLMLAVWTAALPAGTLQKKPGPDYSLFDKKLSKDQQIVHALGRLTFGPRPGDVESVRKIGLKKWIDLQLHPERIKENPELATHPSTTPPAATAGPARAAQLIQAPAAQLIQVKLFRAVYSNRQLEEVLTDFWYNQI